MANQQTSFNKKEKEKNRLKKRLEKQQKKEERKSSSKGGELENMMAYVDEFGNITDVPQDPSQRKKVKLESIEIGVPKREKTDRNPIKKGKIEYYNDSKGFGFIKELETQEKYFFHVRGLLEEVKENDMVIFELERGQKGMNAVRVKKA
jgi:cold shock CspA family protein